MIFFAMKWVFLGFFFFISPQYDDPGAAQRSYACSVSRMSWAASLTDIQESLCIYLCPVIRVSCLLGGCGDLQGHLSWHGLPICSSLSGAVTALFRLCSGWLGCSPTICQHFSECWLFFSFFFFFVKPMLCGVVALLWHCFLPISHMCRSWSRLKLLIMRKVSFSSNVKARFAFQTDHLFTGNLSPAAWGRVSGMFVLLPSIESKIYCSIFIAATHGHRLLSV